MCRTLGLQEESLGIRLQNALKLKVILNMLSPFLSIAVAVTKANFHSNEVTLAVQLSHPALTHTLADVNQSRAQPGARR